MRRWRRWALGFTAFLVLAGGWIAPRSQASITCTLPFTLQNNTTADATQVMANYNALVTCFLSAAAAGVNSDITALLALTTPLNPAQGGSSLYYAGTSTGVANTQVLTTPVPIGFTLTAGKSVWFIAGLSNTGALTLNVNSTGATSVKRATPSGVLALVGGEVVAGNPVEVFYDGTQFVLVNSAALVLAGPLTTLSSAAPDLGTISSHNISLSGTTTITAFGSSAVTTYPIYFLQFQGALTLTYNATSLILPGAINITTAANDTATALYLGSGNWQITSYQRAASQPYRQAAPTYQNLTSGTTYTTPANVTWIRVRAAGAGGGGGGSTDGAVGGTTTFNSVNAVGGTGGLSNRAGGVGGTGGTGTATARFAGNAGGSGSAAAGALGSSVDFAGGSGGASCFGGAGNSDVATVANSGSGGFGRRVSSGGSFQSAGGGGAGECFELVINAPAATYTYAIGAAGVAGTAGGTGGAGRIVVEEYYN